MKNSIFFKFALVICALSLMMTSCSKENVEVIEEKETETVTPVLLITMNGVTTQYNAYAAYCNENGVEAVAVSNNPDILDNEFWNTGSLAEDDFVVHYRNDGTTEISMGGTVFDTEVMGQQTLLFVNDVEATVNITEANSTAVSGDMSGTFFTGIPGPNTATVDYSVEFVAEVDADLVPLFCF